MPLITEQNRTPRTTRRSRQVAAGGFVSLCASPKKTEQGITITGLIPAGLVLVAFCYVFVWSQSVNQWAPFAVISAYLLLLDLLLPPSLVSDFAARKLCHAGCGFGIMLLDSRSELDKWFVWGVSAVSIGMTWDVVKGLPQFRFSRERDVGITIYLMAVSSWFFMELPPGLLAPLFFADPAAAVVGKVVSNSFLRVVNPRVWSNKTLWGSTACVLVTYFSVGFECEWWQRAVIGLAASVAEAVGGEYDNACIGVVVISGWYLFSK